MTLALPVSAVVRFNQLETGEYHRVLDLSKLESALARPLQEYGGVPAHPTVAGRGAALLEGVATAHSFLDANKRTAWMCTVTYLRRQGVALRWTTPERAGGLVLALVNHHVDLDDVARQLVELMEH